MAEPIVPEEVEEVVETPEEETPEAPEVEEVIPPEEPEEPEEAPVESPPPSRRESLRIQALVEKLKQKDVTPVAPSVPGLDYNTALDADPEVVKQLTADREAFGKSLYEEGIKRGEAIQFITRLEIDAPRVESKYPVMNPQETAFDPVVANAINQWYLATTGYNAETGQVRSSNVRYSEFVEGIFELADALAGEKTQQASRTLARQAAQTGIRPGGTTKALNLNKAPEDMTDEELEAKLATVFPKS